MTTLEQMNLSQPLTDVYTAMETDLMMAIAHQLAEGGEINATSEWRLKKLAEAGALSKETVRIIASYTGIQSDLITETIESAAMGVADRLEPALQACAKDGYISAADGTPISESVKNVVTNFRKQAKTDLNLVNTVMQYKAKTSYTTLVNKIYDDTKRQELLGVLGKHTLEVASGGTSRQEAVRNCIKEFSQKGIPAFVDKRGREWSPEAYINMDIRTTVNNTANAAQDACCDRYGLDLIQISSHMGARPKCAIDQGKLYSRSNHSGIAHDGDGNPIPFYPWSSTSYGQPDGILGINCHHHKYPFADGVNFQRYFPYDEEENAERYKEFQKQRAMERRVREVSRQAEMLEAAGDTEGAKAARRQLREKRKAYRDYSKEHGLAVHNDRLTVVKVKNGDTSYRNIYSSDLTDKGGSGIINNKLSDRIIDTHAENDNTYPLDEIENAVISSPIGRSTAKYVEENGLSITINYDADAPIGVCGEIEDRYITVYAINHNNAQEISDTIVHEVSHRQYNWRKTQEDEVNCMLMEYLHTHEDISDEKIKEFIDFVRENYSYLPEGNLYVT